MTVIKIQLSTGNQYSLPLTEVGNLQSAGFNLEHMGVYAEAQDFIERLIPNDPTYQKLLKNGLRNNFTTVVREGLTPEQLRLYFYSSAIFHNSGTPKRPYQLIAYPENSPFVELVKNGSLNPSNWNIIKEIIEYEIKKHGIASHNINMFRLTEYIKDFDEMATQEQWEILRRTAEKIIKSSKYTKLEDIISGFVILVEQNKSSQDPSFNEKLSIFGETLAEIDLRTRQGRTLSETYENTTEQFRVLIDRNISVQRARDLKRSVISRL